ncbi:MAG TPA: aminopeptidase [Saprospiraceae bacterium]|nr:aminopeptidase [Saprospiraceae bacterium]
MTSAFAQYEFKTTINLEQTPVKSQDRTGTCWSYSTASYMESEALRKHESPVDLAEMFIVRYIYLDKARNYILRQGKAQFSQGGLAHDFMREMGRNGVVPQSVYEARPKGEKIYDHDELAAVLKGYLDGVLKAKHPSPYWQDGFEAILDVYLGKAPKTFKVNGQEYTPESYAKSLGFNAKDYIELTSFTHHPFHHYFVLEIPDNYSNGLYYNIPLADLKAQTDYALAHGYTVSWDGDVSEKGFGRSKGVIVLPENNKDLDSKGIVKEVKPTQDLRQKSFENWTTTDDHLMHIVGKAKDQKGNNYYIIKNSWGNKNGYDGLYYMSEAFFLMKTVAIMLPKEALMKSVQPKVFIPVSLD